MPKLEKFQVEELEQRFEMGWKEPAKVRVEIPDDQGVSTTFDL